MMSRADGLVQRRNVNRENADGVSRENGQSAADKLDYEEDIDDGDSKETRLTLMEEVLLLGLKDKEVHIHIYLCAQPLVSVFYVFFARPIFVLWCDGTLSTVLIALLLCNT